MKREPKGAGLQIGVCALILITVCMACRLSFFHTYRLLIPVQGGLTEGERLNLESEDPGAVRFGEAQRRDGYVRVPVEPRKRGEAWISVRDEDGDFETSVPLRVGPMGMVYNRADGSFTGDTTVLVTVTLFWLAVGCIMLWHYRRAKGPAYYRTGSVYYAGFSLFACVTFLVMLYVTANRLIRPADYSMMEAYDAIRGASAKFMELTSPLVLAYAVWLMVSNIALIRHEGRGMTNLLGIALAAVLVIGEALFFAAVFRDFSGSETQYRVRNTLQNVYATVFVYFECMLTGAVICAVTAARHEPPPDRDFILILGCWFRKDGSLPPLLKSRVDRAIRFWNRQKEIDGREAVLIASGGQGANESMAEAEAMRRYLAEQGIPDRVIRVEDRSRNTMENMIYSKEIIDRENPNGKTAWATSSYHVFRSGVWANEAGLEAEGMGSHTKWWFWPNAFIREVAALLRSKWIQELLFLLVLLAFFGLLSMTLS